MAKLAILGSASVVPDEDHENTHLALIGEGGAILIDCVGRPLARLKRLGVAPEQLYAMVLTHFHPDHIGAVPGLLLSQWILGRQEPFDIYGLHHCLQRVEQMMSFLHWDKWSGFFPIVFHHLPQRKGLTVLENDEFRIQASPVRHYVPTIGLRVTVKSSGFVFAYSSDTVPCPEVVRLAQGADLLIHEATGDEPLGHSSAAQAGAIAKQAGAKRLGLIHYPVWETPTDHLVPEARTTFAGEVFLCRDFMTIELG